MFKYVYMLANIFIYTYINIYIYFFKLKPIRSKQYL